MRILWITCLFKLQFFQIKLHYSNLLFLAKAVITRSKANIPSKPSLKVQENGGAVIAQNVIQSPHQMVPVKIKIQQQQVNVITDTLIAQSEVNIEKSKDYTNNHVVSESNLLVSGYPPLVK